MFFVVEVISYGFIKSYQITVSRPRKTHLRGANNPKGEIKFLYAIFTSNRTFSNQIGHLTKLTYDFSDESEHIQTKIKL